MIGPQGTLYFQIEWDSTLYAYNPDGTLKWTYDLGTWTVYDMPTLSKNGNIYVLQQKNLVLYLVVLNPEGVSIMRFNLTEMVGGKIATNSTWPIINAENTIYVSLFHSASSPNWYAIRDSGEIKWKILISPQSPIFLIFRF